MHPAIATLLTLSTFILMILYHEYGHAWAATQLGLTVKSVKAGNSLTFSLEKMGIDREIGLPAARFKLGGVDHEIGLIPFSGNCVIEGLDTAPALTRLIVASAGPVSTVAVAAAFYMAAYGSSFEVFKLFGDSCVAFSICNLLPIPTFDGLVMFKALKELRKT